MDTFTQEIYSTIYKNSVLFLKRGIKEIIKTRRNKFDSEQAIISCLLIQTSIELSLKAYLLKEMNIHTILKNHRNSSNEVLLEKFNQNRLKTKNYDELKKFLKNNNDLGFFEDIHFQHLDKFQMYRNKLIHLNLFFSDEDLANLKNELIFAVTHILIPFLTDISFEFETPSEFYEKTLDKDDFNNLISFQPYVDQMRQIAIEYSGLAYECVNCYKRTFSPNNTICYCCNIDLFDAAGYIDCDACSSKKAVIYDTLNIHVNDHTINGVCMNCGEKNMVYDCPKCETKFTYYGKPDFVEKKCKC